MATNGRERAGLQGSRFPQPTWFYRKWDAVLFLLNLRVCCYSLEHRIFQDLNPKIVTQDLKALVPTTPRTPGPVSTQLPRVDLHHLLAWHPELRCGHQ